MTRLNLPLFVALAASILSAVPVDGRDALPHQRMIRKRGPAGFDGPGPIGAAAVVGLRVRQATDEPTGSASQSVSAAPTSTSAAASTTRVATTSSAAAPTTTAAATSSTAAPATTSTSSSVSTAQATTSSGGLLDSLTAVLGGSTSSTLSSSSSTPVSSSTPAAASSTQAAAPTTTQQQQQQPATQTTPTLNIATPSPSATARNPSVSVSVVTSTQQPEAAASASASAEAAKAKTAKITRNTIVSLVVVASCIGGAIAIWTVIRKWKLSPSEKFDDRMQPIDWAPPPANGATEEAIEEKSKHRRVGSGASHGSFTSGGVGQSEQGHGAKYADSQHGYPPQDFPPPHDFTAGTTQPGGYGQYYGGQQYATGPGYADLQRGPSLSESNYSHGANVSRGLSYSRGHGAYDSQSSAPPMPNPYGGEYGYEDYNHPPAGQQPQAQGQGQVPYRAF